MGRDPLPASLACVDALLLPSLWSMWAELSRLGRGLQEATSCLQLQLLTSSWSPGWLVPEMLFQGSSFVKASGLLRLYALFLLPRASQGPLSTRSAM